LIFSHQPLLLLLNVGFQLCQFVLVNLLLQLDLAALLEDLIVLVLRLFQLLFVALFDLQFLVLIFAELSPHLNQVLL
jgi:hypothetical protein